EIGDGLWSFKYSLTYFAFLVAAGIAFIVMQRRQNALIGAMNHALEGSNAFLGAVSAKISHYLSPQIYKNIFSGEMDVTLTTKRKKLTIFFSDIKDFTALTESLQPEALTELINEYFSAMSAIALKHGGTIDKFIGDALLVFFGDPESHGAAEDAKAAVRMAIEMQHALARLNVGWRQRGVEAPLRVRMGLNTGFCNVGNFGSNERMDYTILGAEANLAARLQSIAAPGGIVVSYETYALVREIVAGHALAPTSMKGIARAVVPYEIDGLVGEDGVAVQVFSEHADGLDLYLDLGRIDGEAAQALRGVLQRAIVALDGKR
ncbi:MAG TPA: adenylate/guanylate cyclase domain-containing protein, partial [Telluria sp.]|nr:adenylate/guanylate cyclase domain-containing protein [Telluria sp.]